LMESQTLSDLLESTDDIKLSGSPVESSIENEGSALDEPKSPGDYGLQTEGYWSTSAKYELIDRVRQVPAVWDRHCPDYKDREIKKGAWLDIATTINRSERDISKVWHLLRSGLIREMHIRRRGTIKNKRWQYEDALQFLVPSIEEYRMLNESIGTSSYEKTGNEKDDEDCDDDNATNSSSLTDDSSNIVRRLRSHHKGEEMHSNRNTGVSKRWLVEDDRLLEVPESKKRNNSNLSQSNDRSESAVANFANLGTEICNKKQNGTVANSRDRRAAEPVGDNMGKRSVESSKASESCIDNSCEKFGQYIASSLSAMTPIQRAQAQLKIQQVLYYVAIGQISDGNAF